jgi:hypothetical protein
MATGKRAFRRASESETLSAIVRLGAFFLAHNTKEVTSSFRQLTFAQSNITGARFAADGQNVIYGTNSAGNAPELFTT